jgi:hypothetical protein
MRTGLSLPFHHSHDEIYRVLLLFIRAGFERGEKAFHIVDPDRRDEHLQRLALAGIDVAAAQRRGQLKLRGWADTYLRDGRFDQGQHLALLEEVLQSGPRQGFPLSRCLTHLEWALEDRADVDGLVVYEARVNYLWALYPDPVICTYDLTKFGGGVVVEVMRTHPMIIIGGIPQENPCPTSSA